MTATFLYVVLLALTFFIKKQYKKQGLNFFTQQLNFLMMKVTFNKIKLALIGLMAMAIMAFTFKDASPKMVAPPPSPSTTQQLIDSINAFKATLTSAQLALVQRDYTLANAKVWSNLPAQLSARIGLPFSSLTAKQIAAAMACVKVASGTTANEGYAEIQQLLAADDYLAANGGGSAYGTGQYYLDFYGTPSLTGTWEFQFGGHHMTLANTYINGTLVGATPSFRGVEPFGAFAYGSSTAQPLLQDRDSLAAMLNGLTTTQLASAKLSATFSDLVLAPGKDWQFPTTHDGLLCSTLTTAQKALVLAAIKTYVYDIDDQNAATILAKYTAEINQTYIAYSGNASLAVANDYVRIDGPSVWIEYSTQGGIIFRNVPHPHSVWRDRSKDYGGTGNPTSVKNIDAAVYKMESFPNPTSNMTTLTFNLPQEMTVKIALYDMTGRLVKAVSKGKMPSGNNSLTVDLSSLAAGVYTYSLENENGERATKRLVKN